MADEQMVLVKETKGAGACRSCGRQVTWTVTVAGRMMPLEAELRVRALLAPELRRRATVRIGVLPGTTKTELARDDQAERRLVAKGYRFRDELLEVWEIPASLTHWANCPTAGEHRR